MRMYGCGPKSAAIWPMAAMMFGGRHGRGRGDWGGDWGERGGPRGPRGRGRVFGSGELRLVLLHLLGETPRHGYDLIKGIEELTDGAYAPSPGVVYPTIGLLLDEGKIEEWGEGSANSKRTLMVTEDGQKELTERADETAKLVERLKALGEADNRHRSPQVARALGNLMAALRNRAAAGDFDKATMLEVTAILDEAAQRIERL